MGSTMGQKIVSGRRSPTLCFLHHILESASFCFAISNHPVLLKDQSDVMLIGPPEPIFQFKTVVTGFHIAASGALDKLSIKRQVIRGDQVVAVFPIHTDHSEQSC